MQEVKPCVKRLLGRGGSCVCLLFVFDPVYKTYVLTHVEPSPMFLGEAAGVLSLGKKYLVYFIVHIIVGHSVYFPPSSVLCSIYSIVVM